MLVAFALLGGKKQSTSRRMISELLKACRNISIVFIPPRIILDFEQGAISAFRHFFPITEFIGCFFHFGQCLFRKLVEIGCKVAYGEDREDKDNNSLNKLNFILLLK